MMTARSFSNPRHILLRIALPMIALAVGFGPGESWAGDGRHGGGRGPRAHVMRGGGAFVGRPMRPEGDVGRGLRLRDSGQAQLMPQYMPQAGPFEQPAGRPGRLSPDERRALRQQINDAGRDIYRAPRP